MIMEICKKLQRNLPSLKLNTNSAWRNALLLRQCVQNDFQVQGYLSIGTFEAVLNWKLRKQRMRTEKHRDELTAELIQNITACFAQVKHEDEKTQREIKINVLCALPGVGLGVASAILTLTQPKDYGIIDYRVWKVLYGEDKRIFIMSDYRKYLEDIRNIASKIDCDVQAVDFLLWEEFERL